MTDAGTAGPPKCGGVASGPAATAAVASPVELAAERVTKRFAGVTALRSVDLELDAEARVGTLRVGEQQLVEIAKALSLSARILIMDEPTSALSPAECRMLFRVIRQLAAAGVAIVFITHRIDEVMLIASRV